MGLTTFWPSARTAKILLLRDDPYSNFSKTFGLLHFKLKFLCDLRPSWGAKSALSHHFVSHPTCITGCIQNFMVRATVRFISSASGRGKMG